MHPLTVPLTPPLPPSPQEDKLMHPLIELRKRYLQKHIQHQDDYALLPVRTSDTGEDRRSFSGVNA